MVEMENLIVIIYYSRENHTKMLAKRFLDIFREFLPMNFRIEMMSATEIDYDKIKSCAGIVVGSPDYFGYVSGYIKVFFDEIYPNKEKYRNKPIIGFITHGGGGKAEKKLRELFTYCDFEIIDPIISVKLDNITNKIESQIQKSGLKMLNFIKEHS